MKIKALHCLPLREGTRVTQYARGNSFGGTKVVVRFLVRDPLNSEQRRPMAITLVGSPENGVGARLGH